MITLPTANYSAGFKRYSYISAENLDDLKNQLTNAGQRFFHLVETNPWDDCWDYIKSNMSVNELSKTDIEWLKEKQESSYSSSRYLGL